MYDNTNPIDIIGKTLSGNVESGSIANIYLEVLRLVADKLPKDASQETLDEAVIIATKIMDHLAVVGITDAQWTINKQEIVTKYLQDIGRLISSAHKTGADFLTTLTWREQEVIFYNPLRQPKKEWYKLLWVTQFLWIKDHPEFKRVCEQLSTKTRSLSLFNGKTTINIGFNNDSLQLLRGLSFLRIKHPDKSIDDLIGIYGKLITHFFTQCERQSLQQFDNIIYVNTFKEWDDKLQEHYKKLLLPTANPKKDFTTFDKLDFNTIRSHIEYHGPEKSVLLVIRGHGYIKSKWQDKWTWEIAGRNPDQVLTTQQWFENLANDKTINTHLVMDIDSCFSGAKFDGKPNSVPVLSMSSYNDTSRFTYDDTIVDAFNENIDYDGDGKTSYADIRPNLSTVTV